ncbi:Formin-like protein 6 [Apostasia shenzhenica]|uniref:Formin-like protein 6 n=1 Tax=Apostasia shenzhenica TaxID=1088818 RepID=A0A2I0A5P1_9ASPA|nr:Formin-like protein 6 [Apostasia shenzhenica]
MAMFRKFFYRKPPDGLFEISERVYGMVSILCFSFFFAFSMIDGSFEFAFLTLC